MQSSLHCSKEYVPGISCIAVVQFVQRTSIVILQGAVVVVLVVVLVVEVLVVLVLVLVVDVVVVLVDVVLVVVTSSQSK